MSKQEKEEKAKESWEYYESTQGIDKIRGDLQDPALLLLADKIVQVIEQGKQALAISINEIIKSTYWKIGQYIVEFEQQGNAKAKYGSSLLTNLSKLLRTRVGRGYSRPNLNNMRNFYLSFLEREYLRPQVRDKMTGMSPVIPRSYHMISDL